MIRLLQITFLDERALYFKVIFIAIPYYQNSVKAILVYTWKDRHSALITLILQLSQPLVIYYSYTG